VRALPVLLLVAATACSNARPPADVPAQVPTVRLGAGRADVPYDEPFAREKRALLRKINAERREAGLVPVEYSLRAARAGDAYCRDAAAGSFSGHWDLEGRPPHLRWAEAGGVDQHAENSASETRRPGPIVTPIGQLLLEAHARMMAEVPPDDGHRRTVLDPYWTHVGIGAALAGGEFRMTEEFVREVADWVEIPAGPLPAGSVAPFAAKVPAGWTVALVAVSFEPLPKPMTAPEISARRRYGLSEPYRRILSLPGAGMSWEGGEKGEFAVGPGGDFRLGIPLDRGPGDYWVLVFASKGLFTGRAMTPCTAARIRAR
jgi:uncharacterized protein YkwD